MIRINNSKITNRILLPLLILITISSLTLYFFKKNHKNVEIRKETVASKDTTAMQNQPAKEIPLTPSDAPVPTLSTAPASSPEEIIFRKPVRIAPADYPMHSIEKQKEYLKNVSWADGGERLDSPVTAVKEIPVKEGDYVVDIGSCTGYYTFTFAKAVGAKGFVYATDINPDLLKIMMVMRAKTALEKNEYYNNIIPMMSYTDDLTIEENRIDVAILVQVHILHYTPDWNEGIDQIKGKTQEETMAKIYRKHESFLKSVYKAVKPGGKFAVIEHDRDVPYLVLQKPYVVKMVEKTGFKLERDVDEEQDLGYQFLVFRK